MVESMIDVYVDGLVEPINPGGIGAIGFIVYKNGKKIHEEKKIIGEGIGMSNNKAEYEALGEALQWLLDEGFSNEHILVHSDSVLVVNQMQGKWKVKGGLFISAYQKAKTLAERFLNLYYQWIPREENEEADLLTKEAYNERRKLK